MSNSPLVSYTKISPHKHSPRNHEIDTITIHIVVGQCSVEALGAEFAKPSKKASSNYGIGYDGRIALYVDEGDRSWCSSNAENDNRAVTIECASDMTEPYAVNDKVYKSLIKLCADICKRNNIKELKWKADKSLVGQINKQNMTVHRWFANKTCPGEYLYSRMGQIAKEVNAMMGVTAEVEPKPEPVKPESSSNSSIKKGSVVTIKNDATYYDGTKIPGWVKSKEWIVKSVSGDRVVIDKSVDGECSIMSAVNVKFLDAKGTNTTKPETTFKPYVVRVNISYLNIRKGPGTNYDRTGTYTGKGSFTIVEERAGEGSKAGWGRLKSGAGWISLDYAQKL